MNARRVLIIGLTTVLLLAVLAGVTNALEGNPRPVTKAALENVRAYTPAAVEGGLSYAIDGGLLFAGGPASWTQVITPKDVMVSVAAVDPDQANTLYIGAANEMAIYRTIDGGRSWLRIALGEGYIGGVTSIALDSVQNLIYVGTDTAGLFRLRDVGSGIVLTGHLLVDEPVLEVVTDSVGTGYAFARTEWNLYRAENYGMSWVTVDNLQSIPTALAIANSQPARLYVGTMDRGVLASDNGGMTWSMANEGLNFVAGARLQVTDIAVDPVQPEVVYVASNYLYGSSEVHATPSTVAMSNDSAMAWAVMEAPVMEQVAELMPVAGVPGALYALTTSSRTPAALGNAMPVSESGTAQATVVEEGPAVPGWIAWVIAGLAATALVFAVALDLRSQQAAPRRGLATVPARNNR
jgi:hypothetical protein